MSNYNDDYFFIRRDENNERLPFLRPFLQPDVNTGERRYAQYPPVPGSAPLIFTNGFKDEFMARGVKDAVADILFDGVNFIVCDAIRERLIDLDIPHVHLHPAVYIDDLDNWHENFWYVGITNEFDCWDRATSTFGKKSIVIDGETLHNMFSYSLDTQAVDAKPLPERLLFQMGGTADGLITCHRTLAPVFRRNRTSGAVLQPITDY